VNAYNVVICPPKATKLKHIKTHANAENFVKFVQAIRPLGDFLGRIPNFYTFGDSSGTLLHQ